MFGLRARIDPARVIRDLQNRRVIAVDRNFPLEELGFGIRSGKEMHWSQYVAAKTLRRSGFWAPVLRAMQPYYFVPENSGRPPTSSMSFPTSTAPVGGLIVNAGVPYLPTDVISAMGLLESLQQTHPERVERLRKQEFPHGVSDELLWLLARDIPDHYYNDPVVMMERRGGLAEKFRYVQGIRALHTEEHPVSLEFEQAVLEAARRIPMFGALSAFSRLAPEIHKAIENLEMLPWELWKLDPSMMGHVHSTYSPMELFVSGVLAKATANTHAWLVRSERRLLEIDGERRIYAIHTPPGTPPSQGWPTMIFFHGIGSGYAPDQHPEYQDLLNEAADRAGFQVVYAVGIPQPCDDPKYTAHGRLSWEPVGCEEGGRNDKYVQAIMKSVIQRDKADPSRFFAVGHSAGGFYVSGLLATQPNSFRAAVIFNAGTGAFLRTSPDVSQRISTPVLIRIGAKDIHHIDYAHDLAKRLQGSTEVTLDIPPDEGHDFTPEGVEKMFHFFASKMS